jgi:hypothetical protein
VVTAKFLRESHLIGKDEVILHACDIDTLFADDIAPIGGFRKE